jgi:flagellar biosynthetic protein FlhB
MAEESFQERTEKATPKRVKEAREKGQVAQSQELNAVVVMLCGVSALLFLGPAMAHQLRDLTVWLLTDLSKFVVGDINAQNLMAQVGWIFVKATGPVILVLTVIAFAIVYVQVGYVFSTTALEPKFDKLNVVNGLKNLISIRSMVTLTRDVIKLVVIVLVAYYAVKKEIPTFVTLTQAGTAEIAASMIGITVRICFKVLLALLIIALLDFAYQRFEYFKGLRMSHQDMKDEFKLTEGSPQIKSRIRSLQREMSRKRMMQEVPKADVVITNPTHLAVALKYDVNTMEAPTVVAKGERLIALTIRKIAEEAGIPIVENKPLAQALFKTVEIGMQVPANLYRAVAEILAYVYSLKGKTK